MKRPFTRGRRSATCLRHSYRTVFENERVARLLWNLDSAFSRASRRSAISSGSSFVSSPIFLVPESGGDEDAEFENESNVVVESPPFAPCLDVGVVDVQSEWRWEIFRGYPVLADNSNASRRTHASAIISRLNGTRDAPFPSPLPPSCRRPPFSSSCLVCVFRPRHLLQRSPLEITAQQSEHHDGAILSTSRQ